MDKPANPDDQTQLLKYLDKNPWDATAIIWTLNLDATPIYAIQPRGSFGSNGYERLRQFLNEQLTEGGARISVPGTIAGQAKLFTGQVVPVISSELRGMYSWMVTELIKAVTGLSPPAKGAQGKEKEEYSQKTKSIRNFLERIYFEFRNLGITPQERALDFAGTNAFNIEKIFESAIKDDMELDSIEVERSPICRPDSDCWDVKLLFFDPKRQLERARKVYRTTVDVSDVVPVAVGPVRSWSVR